MLKPSHTCTHIVHAQTHMYTHTPCTYTVPSAAPSSVRVSVESSTAISVQWGPVEPCADQNGPITGYSVRYGEVGSGSTQNKTVSGNSIMTTISGLTKETVYTVEVAAETSAGTGVYSLPLTIQTPDSEGIFTVSCMVCVSE